MIPARLRLLRHSRSARLSWLLPLLVALSPVAATAATDNGERTWTSSVGTTLRAELVEANDDEVVLLGADGIKRTVRLEQLSEADQAYVEEATRVTGNTTIPGIDAEPGRISGPIKCADAPEWSYYLYLPEGFHDARKWPVWFVMAAGGGRNGRPLQRYVKGAERLGCIVALSVQSKNRFADSDIAIEAMIEDVYDRLPVADDLAFTSGMSGGSRMAYLIAERERNVAGVLACGSGKGIYIKQKDYREADLRSSTYVYSLIGTNCFNRTGAFQSHDTFPDDYRLRFFPGKHTWAGKDLIEQGMARVLGAGLERYRGDNAEGMRREYVETMLEWAKKRVESEPWEAHYWADYLEDFPGPRALQYDADRLRRELDADPRVVAARKAERDILDFADDYFHVFYKKDGKPNAKRKEEAQRLAEKYPDIPHGKILRLLGNPS